MKRTTIWIDESLEADLRLLARRKGWSGASLVREALADYVAAEKRRPSPRLGFVALGGSGHHDTAERHEELLFREEPQPWPSRRRRPRPRRRT